MQLSTHPSGAGAESWSVVHPISAEDAAVIAAMRAVVEPMKGRLQGIAARQPYDDIMGHVSVPAGVTYEEDVIGGVPGWWCHPVDARPEGVILHLHGGWFSLGTAQAYRYFTGHIASRAGAAAFVADYRLAPEHPFPAAILDAQACFKGLIERGFQRVAIVGDSAGGCLGLAMTSILASEGGDLPVGAVALSPVTDLTMSGESWETRAEADPYFIKSQAAELVQTYLAGHDPKDPLASPLYGDLAWAPPIRVHVGDDEVLLDDSRRYVERAVAAGVDARLDIWLGAPHVFQNSVGRLDAADEALNIIGAFLAERLAAGN